MSGRFPIEVTEKRTVKRVTVKQSITDFLDAFNVERGLIYTVKLLFTKPGMLIRFYLTEGRFKIVNAFRLLIITTAMSLILLSFTDSFKLIYNVEAAAEQTEKAEEISQFMDTLFTDWYNLIIWISIPFYALSSYLLMRRYERFNYAEHLVVQSFLVSISNILVIVCLPFGYFIGFRTAFALSFFIALIYYFFVFWDLFKLRKFWFFFRVFIAYLFGNLLYIIFFMIVFGTIMVSQLSES